MSSVTKILNRSRSSTTITCAKNIHFLAKKTSQVETTRRITDSASERHLIVTEVNPVPKGFVQFSANFCIHPEKLRRIIKEKDAEILCNFISKEGYKKRRQCLAYREQRNKLIQSGIGPYVIRDSNPMALTPKKQPTSYTSYIDSQLKLSQFKRSFSSSTQIYSLQGGLVEKRPQENAIPAVEQSDIALDSHSKRRFSSDKRSIRKKKRLRPLQVFKRTRYLNQSSQTNLPPEIPTDKDYEDWGYSYFKGDLGSGSPNLEQTNKVKGTSAAMNNVTRDRKDDTNRPVEYLIRLPKTTPEGYRVLLYSVRDNDPTKMNFADCIKGFCMYNDCVLSEDGLQEGYIVIFDMKGVQLGHLARVSLPALRCFMLYIQEAHPCRLKAIHILNTSSWIHHVMRLIVPLVRSELLNLVRFHKDNTPEGLPLELLPSEYGGEAPSVEYLDNETKSMVDKYHEWLVESAEWKSDETKRVKKSSWWGLFNGSNKTDNVELDEKTILKNLQID